MSIAPPARCASDINPSKRASRFQPLLEPRPLITVGVGRKQQCRDDLFINADVKVPSPQVGRWLITCSQINRSRQNAGCTAGCRMQLNPALITLTLRSPLAPFCPLITVPISLSSSLCYSNPQYQPS